MALSDISVGDMCRVHWCIGHTDSGRPYVDDGWFNDTIVWESGTMQLKHDSSTYSGKYDVCNLSSSSCSIYLANADMTPYFNVTYYEIYIYKQNPAWAKVSKAYKKVNGSWVEQSDLTTVFDSTKHYKKGN